MNQLGKKAGVNQATISRVFIGGTIEEDLFCRRPTTSPPLKIIDRNHATRVFFGGCGPDPERMPLQNDTNDSGNQIGWVAWKRAVSGYFLWFQYKTIEPSRQINPWRYFFIKTTLGTSCITFFTTQQHPQHPQHPQSQHRAEFHVQFQYRTHS